MRFLSICLPFLATDRIRRLQGPSPARREDTGNPHAEGRTGKAPLATPLATWAKIGSAQQLVAVDAAALHAGLRPGMALASARAMRPELELHQAEPQAEAELLACFNEHLRITRALVTEIEVVPNDDMSYAKPRNQHPLDKLLGGQRSKVRIEILNEGQFQP